MTDFQAIVTEYDQLVLDSGDPKNTARLAEIGERISELQPKVTVARNILTAEKELQQAEQLLGDPELGNMVKAELDLLQTKHTKLLEEYQKLQVQDFNSEDPRPAIVEFRGGAGGDEAKIWVADLKRMYLRFADIVGLKHSYIDENTLIFSGRPDPEHAPGLPQGAYGLLKWESGVHRVQRVPTTESQGRIHTSTASIAVLPKVDKNKVEIRDEDLEWQFFRSGGKGGQNVNKVSTGVRLIHAPTGITVVSTQERYQQRNREIALDLLLSQLWEKQEEERLGKLAATRRSAVGTGARAEKIRTFNYPQNRVTDHRIGESWHNLDTIIQGNLTDLLVTLHQQINQL